MSQPKYHSIKPQTSQQTCKFPLSSASVLAPVVVPKHTISMQIAITNHIQFIVDNNFSILKLCVHEKNLENAHGSRVAAIHLDHAMNKKLIVIYHNPCCY